ncbi:MAG: ABC transporter ATP-binding protein [Lachnospiraceae bacterium]|nr:ABC transporter ATP-binding protein [Lachnospiraceae bacterium]
MKENKPISVEHVSKSFGERKVLKDVCVEFEKGQIYGIVGRNGSGKSMLLKCICGFVAPTEGEVTVNGKRVGKEVDFPEEIGFIIETPGFLPQYSAYENLKYLYSIRKKTDPAKIRKYIELVGLDPDEKKHVGKYSMGMKQRLAIAQALMEESEIIILDEPFNGLDEKGVQEMREVLLELKLAGRVILLASHSREDVEYLCDVVYRMDGGVMERSV